MLLLVLGDHLEDQAAAEKIGLTFGAPTVDLDALRAWTSKVVDGLAGGVSHLLERRGVEVVQGRAHFAGPNTLSITDADVSAVEFRDCIIATGSRPIVPKAWEAFGDKILTTDDIFEQEELPGSIAVIGLGIVGLELGQALHRMGLEVTGIDQLETIGGLPALESLNLYGTSVTDEGLKHLKGLTNLKELSLTGTEVTDAGIAVHAAGAIGDRLRAAKADPPEVSVQMTSKIWKAAMNSTTSTMAREPRMLGSVM